MANLIAYFLWKATLLSFGFFNYVLFLLIGIRKGGLRKPSAREENEYLLGKPRGSLTAEIVGLRLTD